MKKNVRKEDLRKREEEGIKRGKREILETRDGGMEIRERRSDGQRERNVKVIVVTDTNKKNEERSKHCVCSCPAAYRTEIRKLACRKTRKRQGKEIH